jgi:outer membrane protein TolC
MAVEHNRSLESAKLQIAKAEEELAAAKTRRLPAFDVTVFASQLLTPANFSFPQGAFGAFPGTGPIPATDTTVTTPRQPNLFVSSQLTQPLSQQKRIGLGIRGAEAARDIERERSQGQLLAVVNNVKRLYFSILQTESAIAACDEAISLYHELSRTLETRVAQRVALRSDALDVDAKLAQEEYTRITRVNSLESQKEQLNLLLGRDVRTTFDAEEVTDMSPLEISLEAAQGRSLQDRPDVREARIKADQADLDRRMKGAERIPDVSLAVAYTSNFNMDVLPQNLASVGVQVKWEPFDWGRKGRELAAKTQAVSQARLAVHDAEDRAIAEVNSRFRALGETRALLNVAQAAQRAARERLRVKTNQFQTQSVMLADVLRGRADLADTDDRFQQALAAFWTAKADFERAVGEDVIP